MEYLGNIQGILGGILKEFLSKGQSFASKLAHYQPKPLFYSPASLELIFHIINMSKDTSVSLFAKFLKSLDQFIQTVKGHNNFL